MKILDWYILKRYLSTFFMLFLIFIPIGIIVDLAEKIGKMLKYEVPLEAILEYYQHFIIYFANLLLPVFVFLSVIFFTSKLANNTEIIAFLSSGVPYTRFLRPYIIGSLLIGALSLSLGLFLAPRASKGFNDFRRLHLKRDKGDRKTRDVYRQINDSTYLYARNYSPVYKSASFFTLETYKNHRLQQKLIANRIKYIDSQKYSLRNVLERKIGMRDDVIRKVNKLDTVLSFTPEELTPISYVAETLDYYELKKFIALEEKRGSVDINRYKVVAHKRWGLPLATFILTIIGVALSSNKKRGGMGRNIFLGIIIAMSFVFLDRVLGTLATQSDFSPMVAVWGPNVVYGILAIFLLVKARR